MLIYLMLWRISEFTVSMNGESHSSATSPLMDGSDGTPPIKKGDFMKNGRFAMV